MRACSARTHPFFSLSLSSARVFISQWANKNHHFISHVCKLFHEFKMMRNLCRTSTTSQTTRTQHQPNGFSSGINPQCFTFASFDRWPRLCPISPPFFVSLFSLFLSCSFCVCRNNRKTIWYANKLRLRMVHSLLAVIYLCNLLFPFASEISLIVCVLVRWEWVRLYRMIGKCETKDRYGAPFTWKSGWHCKESAGPRTIHKFVVY